MSVPVSVLIRIREALEDGDVGFAYAIAESAEGGAYDSPPTVPCRVCGDLFRWPGLRDSHEITTHGYAHDEPLREAA